MPEIRINLAEQRLVLHGGEKPFSAVISSGAAGIGFTPGSGCTPTGRFRVYSRHGIGAPLLTIFRARIPIGIYNKQSGDCILTRILCLDGLDEANANTRARYIYIHGTGDVEHLGTPVSAGCIRLSPQDMVRLFELTPIGTPVFIS